jgi:thymidylate synthase ThyX
MIRKREIYCLKDIPEEVVAVAFAKTSRSPELIKDIVKDLTEENSSKFHEKWVVGFGHSSVAEHAVIHIALDNVSRMAVESIESNRLASYTEKSSRYQTYDRTCYYIPEKFKDAGLEELYVNACNLLIDTYQEALPKVKELICQQNPRREGEEDRAYEGRILSKYIDVCRFLLPYATLANMGMTANARTLEHAISKMLSSPLEEVREIGKEIKTAAINVTPTLLRNADEKEYIVRTREKLTDAVRGIFNNEYVDRKYVELVDYEEDAEEKFIASCIYKHYPVSFKQAYEKAKSMNEKEKLEILDIALGSLSGSDTPVRELEIPFITFDCLMDLGAWFDLKRNRMMTQIQQEFAPNYGYGIPKLIEQVGMKDKYCKAIRNAEQAYYKIAKVFPEDAKYILTNAHNRRMLMKMNLRELFYFVKLRGRMAGHFSYRHITSIMYELACEKYPTIMKYLSVSDNLNSSIIEENNLCKPEITNK